MIAVYPSSELYVPTVEVDHFDSALIDKLELMAKDLQPSSGLGVAANQVGLHERMFIYQLPGMDFWSALINPAIVEAHGAWTFKEGCLSLPGMSWYIRRPKFCTVKGFDKNGMSITLLADDLRSRLFQHEIDHLDGRLILDRISASERKVALRAMFETFVEEKESAPEPGR